MDIKDRLRGKLTAEELAHVRTSFDIVGDIAIIKVPDEIAHHKRLIADAVLDQHRNVSTVLRKVGERTGEYRNASYEVLRGDSTETMHREHGCRFRLDPTKTYFSVRLGHERERILDHVTAGETVVDMFAGIGPFSILLARHGDVERVYAVEKNPDAAQYLTKNVALNKVENTVAVYNGDAAAIVPQLGVTADRIIMNLPKFSEQFIPAARSIAEPGTNLHFYTFVAKEDLWDAADADVVDAFKDHGVTVEVVHHEVCGHYNPAVERVCFDVRVVDLTEKEQKT